MIMVIKDNVKFFVVLVYLEILVFFIYFIRRLMYASSYNISCCYVMVIFLVFIVADAVVGLSLLVRSSRASSPSRPTLFFVRGVIGNC